MTDVEGNEVKLYIHFSDKEQKRGRIEKYQAPSAKTASLFLSLKKDLFHNDQGKKLLKCNTYTSDLNSTYTRALRFINYFHAFNNMYNLVDSPLTDNA